MILPSPVKSISTIAYEGPEEGPGSIYTGAGGKKGAGKEFERGLNTLKQKVESKKLN